MSSYFSRRVFRISTACLGVCISMAVCGCAIASKSVTYDSISKMPWFGLELKGRKKKSDDPPFRSVRSDERSGTRLKALGLFGDKSTPTTSALNTPKKSATALPTSDQSITLDSVGNSSAGNFDFR
jgi:hypothetical protein